MGDLIIPGIDQSTGQRKLLKPGDSLVDPQGNKLSPFHYLVATLVAASAPQNTGQPMSLPAVSAEVDTAGMYDPNNPNKPYSRDGGTTGTFTGRQYFIIPDALDGRLIRVGARVTLDSARTAGMRISVYQYNATVGGGGNHGEIAQWEITGRSGAGANSNGFLITPPIPVCAGEFFNILIINKGSLAGFSATLDASAVWAWTID